MIRYREIQPSAPLRPFVHTFWILEHDGEEGVQRVVPDGRSELILNWGQPFEAFQAGRWQGQPNCFLAGQIDGPLLLRPAVQRRCWELDFSRMELLACFRSAFRPGVAQGVVAAIFARLQ